MKRKTRFVAIITAVLMCSLLSGCKSSDYKKAQELYSSGNYEEAQTVFFKLGDYEDSTQMVEKCDKQKKYQTLQTYLKEEGPYTYGSEGDGLSSFLFTLSAPEDGSEKVVANFEYDVKIETRLSTLSTDTHRTVCVTATIPYEIDEIPTVPIEGESTEDIEYLDDDLFQSICIKDKCSGVWEIKGYVDGDDVKWEDYNASKDVKWREDNPLVSSGLAKPSKGDSDGPLNNQEIRKFTFSLLAMCVNQALMESGSGLTMADLGFLAYESN